MKLRRLLPLFLFALLASSCAKKETSPEAASLAGDETPAYSSAAWQARALLQTGKNPIWFELAPEGPVPIESPEAAALTPFNPWPHARYAAGVLPWDDALVMALNRSGFLVLMSGAGNTEALLFMVTDGLWDDYTAESFFIWENRPAVLLYRNDFFSDSSAPPLKPQVYALDKSNAAPVSVSIPALDGAASGWEAEAVRRGPDGFWYYRAKEKNSGDTAYFRTENLSEAGTAVPVGAWRNSSMPEEREIPLLIERILVHAESLGLGNSVRAVSPDFEGQRFFALNANSPSGLSAENGTTILYGFCRDAPRPLALAVLPGGQGIYTLGEDAAWFMAQFALPVLPEGFAYTGIALLGEVLAALWEEQQDAGIGAAGFMVMALGAIIPEGN